MKKLLIAVGLGLISGSLYAACNGPYCYDDTGASIQGSVSVAGPLGMNSKTKALMQAYSAGAAGQVIYCSDCAKSALCVSTGTLAGAFVTVSSYTATDNHCQ